MFSKDAQTFQLKEEKKICLSCKRKRKNSFFTNTKEKVCIECKLKSWRKEIKSEPKKMKAKAWRAFSIFIRTRDALQTTGTKEEALCVSCLRRNPISEMHAGHFIGGRKNAVLFHEKIVHAQCAYCNKHLSGNYTSYYEEMVRMYGREKVEALIQIKHEIKDYTIQDYEEIAQIYKDKKAQL